MTKILVFDNYDSFTYNLVHLAQKITGVDIDVYRNDAIGMQEIAVYDKIILSPGPGIPKEAGRLMEVLEHYAKSKSLLGVCLGHQAIGEAFGGTLTNLTTVYHGLATPINIIKKEAGIFAGLPGQIVVGRYHSWVVNEVDLPEDLEITAVDENGLIMAMEHKQLDVQGLQFHPESILTPDGEAIMKNWFAQ